MKEKGHNGHGGDQACLRRAREALYWPVMTSEIKHYVSVCEACTMYETANKIHTLIPHELPERPWEKIEIDSFDLEGVENLVTGLFQ